VFPTGIKTVIINDKIVVKDGSYQEGVLAGEIIKANDI